MTEMTTSSAAEVAGYLKQWMFNPNHAPHPLLAKSAFTGSADRNTSRSAARTAGPLTCHRPHHRRPS
jgi:hypothetical protein